MTAFPRSLVASAALLAAAAAPASAAPALVTEGSLVDAGSDGRMVLTTDRLIDRQTGASDDLTYFSGRGVDVADTARKALYETTSPSGERSLTLYNLERSGANDLLISANIGPDRMPVPWGGHAKLVRNGAAVIFDTAESTPRIIEFTFGSGAAVVRVSGATLLDASEDGTLVTYRRQLAAVSRPAGQVGLTGDRADIGGSSVGYQLSGQAPRIAATTTAVQSYVTGFGAGACDTRLTEWRTSTPTNLQVSQRGDGTYALYLSSQVSTSSYDSHGVIERLTAAGTSALADAGNPSRRVELFPDPVSGAYALVTTAKPNGPVLNTPSFVAADGTARALGVIPVPGAGGSYDDSGFYTRLVAIGGGASVIYGAVPVTRDSSLARPTVYATDGAAPTGDNPQTAWLTLPRSGDATDAATSTPDVTWAQCEDAPAAVAGAFGDYATFASQTTGNSAGALAFTTAPVGLIAATSVKASITWLGLPLWSRTLSHDGTIRLPAIPAGLGGLRGTAVITLADGTVLRASTVLRRAR